VSRGEFARRFTASSDRSTMASASPPPRQFHRRARLATTLNDVVSYASKHNEANGEHNRDGRDGELSANFGVEGPSDDPSVRATRERVRRAMLATLLLAQGTPMLNAGDEIGNSQGGNNNAYCQDNPTGWLDWPHADMGLSRFVGELLALRRAQPLLRHDDWSAASRGVRWCCPPAARDAGSRLERRLRSGLRLPAHAPRHGDASVASPSIPRHRATLHAAARRMDPALDSSAEWPATDPLRAALEVPPQTLSCLCADRIGDS
jgi:pullulanase/glycogen debranching enzyme